MCGIPRLLGVSGERNWELRERTDEKVLPITQGKPIWMQAVKKLSVLDGDVVCLQKLRCSAWDSRCIWREILGHTGQKSDSEVLHWWAEEETRKDAPHQSTRSWDLKCVTYSYHRDLEGSWWCWLHNSTVLLWKSLRILFLSLRYVRMPIHVSLPPLLLY